MSIVNNPRIRAKFCIGDSIVDDFCYFSVNVKIGNISHVGSSCTIAGGKEMNFRLGDYSSLSSGVRIYCTSNDFVNDPITFGFSSIKGDVEIGNYCGVGTNSVIMPNNKIPDGVAIGALSFVPPNFKFKKWSVYAGIPIRFIKKRNKETVLKCIKR